VRFLTLLENGNEKHSLFFTTYIELSGVSLTVNF